MGASSILHQDARNKARKSRDKSDQAQKQINRQDPLSYTRFVFNQKEEVFTRCHSFVQEIGSNLKGEFQNSAAKHLEAYAPMIAVLADGTKTRSAYTAQNNVKVAMKYDQLLREKHLLSIGVNNVWNDAKGKTSENAVYTIPCDPCLSTTTVTLHSPTLLHNRCQALILTLSQALLLILPKILLLQRLPHHHHRDIAF